LDEWQNAVSLNVQHVIQTGKHCLPAGIQKNSALITPENWRLEGHMLYMKVHAVPLQHCHFYYKYENTISY